MDGRITRLHMQPDAFVWLFFAYRAVLNPRAFFVDFAFGLWYSDASHNKIREAVIHV